MTRHYLLLFLCSVMADAVSAQSVQDSIMQKSDTRDGFGFDTEVSSRLDDEGRLSWFETLNLSYRKGGFDLSATLRGAYDRSSDYILLTQHTYQEGYLVQNSLIEKEYTDVNPYASLCVSYTFDDDNSLGARFSYDRLAKNNDEGTQDFAFSKKGETIASAVSDNVSPARSTVYSANAYYLGKIGNVGIDFNTDFYWYGRKNRMELVESSPTQNDCIPEQSSTSRRQSRNSQIASRLAFSLPLLNGDFSIGAEYSSLHRRMHYTISPIWALNENERIREAMTSGFAEYSHNIGPLSLQAGIRYEYVDFDYYSDGQRVATQSKTYGEWLPSLTLTLPVGSTEMQLAYSSDIQRPKYYDLRDGMQYDNLYTYTAGNPSLRPTIMRNISYSLSWDWLSAQLTYSHVKDEICTMIHFYKETPMMSVYTPENVPSYNKLQLALSAEMTIGIWTPQLDMTLTKQWFRMNAYGGERLNRPLAEFDFSNTIDTRWLTAALEIQAQTEGNIGNTFIRKGFFNADLTLTKYLCKKNLRLQFIVGDLFHTANERTVVYTDAQRITCTDSITSTTFTLGLRYTFNNHSSRYKGKGTGQSQRERIK